MGPAGSTVLRNVLISQVSEVVNTVGIVPHPVIRQIDTLERSADMSMDLPWTLLPAWASQILFGDDRACSK